MATRGAPTTVVVSFQRPNGSPVCLLDLGMDFLDANGIPMHLWERRFRVEVDGRISKAGNTFYQYQQNGVPLPDGLDTRVCVEDTELAMGPEHMSNRGHPTRDGKATLRLGGTDFVAKAYLTKGQSPYWIRIVAHKRPDPGAKPRGGRML